MPLNMKNIYNLPSGKKWISRCDVHGHQKHLVQSGHSTRSAADIFNTRRVFTKEPIREQEIKLECMNAKQKLCLNQIILLKLCQV